ncbi:synaptonemal complex protein 1 [Mugil cephalus]|uniref:synaptonemal complex protein 1 n=1 Tax=Mugil cephalus TaxID=48193 RepID=UPI001FB5ECC6|nr:synaptonemal complex protein 1 [Mugil cephalus]XP_047439862.1 synaptonemal complex protein 1 [Mugil cephalus]
MERDRGFNFKLLVPPRVNTGQISAVRPQRVVENCGDFMTSMQQGLTECFDMPLPNTSVVAPTKPVRPDFPKMKVVPPMEKGENNCNPGQLYSKLFDEVEKIKCWKTKVDCDTVQKERRLQDNKRTIETQRKAIQELQFGNESLSIKLEEQISENEDLRNKNNATRNLCNILKDTFQWSADKMHLFESEREETHHLFLENSENVKKMIAAFESLRIRVEADQQEMQKVKEEMLQFEGLTEKYHQANKMKDEEVVVLQTKLKDKENKLQKLQLDLDDAHKNYKQLQEASEQQFELLKNLTTENESLLQKLNAAEEHCKETVKNQETIAAALEQSKTQYAKTIEDKDLSLQELNRVKSQQAEKLEQLQSTIQDQNNSLALEIHRAQELEEKLLSKNNELERRNILLGETMEQVAQKDGLIKTLEDELEIKSKSIESMKGKTDVSEAKAEELVAELSRKTEEVQSFKIKVQKLEEQLFAEIKQNKERTVQVEQLRKDILQHEAKYEELLLNFNDVQSEKIAIQQQFENGDSNMKAIETNIKVSEEKAVKLTAEIQRLEDENRSLRGEVQSIKNRVQRKCQETETLQKKIDENCEHLQEKISEKEKHIKSVETKLCNLRKKFEIKFKAQEEYKKENKILKKQIQKEIEKSSDLEKMINCLHEESQNLKSLKEKDHPKLLEELESKSTFAAELENEVKKLRMTAEESIKIKEDTELKCQHKIADMVALMEKHKSQYDRMVEEKDAELDEKKKKEMAMVADVKSLALDLSKYEAENDQLKKQLKTETTKTEDLQKQLNDFKIEMSAVKVAQPLQEKNKESTSSNNKQGRSSETPQGKSSKGRVFDLSKTRTASSHSKEDGRKPCGTTLKTKHTENEVMKTPGNITSRIVGTSKIKSYRIRTPPSAEKAAQWEKSTVELDPRSDSSDQNDILTFANVPESTFSAPLRKLDIFKRVQSPVRHKSPGNSLKLAAMKRMRDAGWTAVTGCDKKKKKTIEKIFA